MVTLPASVGRVTVSPSLDREKLRNLPPDVVQYLLQYATEVDGAVAEANARAADAVDAVAAYNEQLARLPR